MKINKLFFTIKMERKKQVRVLTSYSLVHIIIIPKKECKTVKTTHHHMHKNVKKKSIVLRRKKATVTASMHTHALLQHSMRFKCCNSLAGYVYYVYTHYH